ncbi:poly-gamma-glutamate biosynthesis (capsule formation)-like protein [Mesorhizobium loti]|nr:poly-gamma-glutamate biosynthesis (capsule formation)-like protein [Mesorhizobium loti]PBC07484.1 poly-gamma-glutamate biosynthesis (capsule formation)-like protein [Mesorhizobium sp. WSM3859]
MCALFRRTSGRKICARSLRNFFIFRSVTRRNRHSGRKGMRHHLPATYIDVLKSPGLGYRLKMAAIHSGAQIFGFWQKPWAKATEASDEYGFLDEAYSNYKYRNPITVPETGVSAAAFHDSQTALELPTDFERVSSLSMGAAGDLMPAEGLELSKDIFYENVADVLLNVDLSFANLEAPITNQKVEVSFTGGDAPVMGFTPSEFAAIAGHKATNFKALNFANNHALDRGLEGLDTTARLFDEHGIKAVGTPTAAGDYGRATIFLEKGIKIGFASATQDLNGFELPQAASHRIHKMKLTSRRAPPDIELLTRQIADAKAQHCDFVVASLHWGYEAEFFPRKRQIDVAHALIEEGADLILGHHPHVIQPVELYRTKRDKNRIAVIAYSLGGLGYRWYTAPHFALGLILNMQLAKGLNAGKEVTYIERMDAVPVFQNIFLSHFGDVKLKRLERLEDHTGDRSTSPLNGYASKIKRYADLVLK